MAFQNFEMAPPADTPVARTAEVALVPASTPKRAAFVGAAPPARDYGEIVALALLAIVVLAAGIRAGIATESLAIGIIAADFTFLIAAAGWSAFAGRRKGR